LVAGRVVLGGVGENGELAPEIENGHAGHVIVLILFWIDFTRDTGTRRNVARE
jgi:hypothetical protein